VRSQDLHIFSSRSSQVLLSHARMIAGDGHPRGEICVADNTTSI
jgi:hypothetical protein